LGLAGWLDRFQQSDGEGAEDAGEKKLRRLSGAAGFWLKRFVCVEVAIGGVGFGGGQRNRGIVPDARAQRERAGPGELQGESGDNDDELGVAQEPAKGADMAGVSAGDCKRFIFAAGEEGRELASELEGAPDDEQLDASIVERAQEGAAEGEGIGAGLVPLLAERAEDFLAG
jgi:hypothetical protein